MKRVFCLLASIVSLITTRAADDPLIGVVSVYGGSVEISVIYQQPVDTTSMLNLENYKLSQGQLLQLRPAATNQGVILSASGLPQRSTNFLTITGIVDQAQQPIGNALLKFKVDERIWTTIGGNELGFIPDVLSVNTNGFDLFSGGIQQTDDYDEATFVGQELMGDFDEVIRVTWVDPAGRNAKAGIMVRENLNSGMSRPVDPEDPATMFSRYIELSVRNQTSVDGQASGGTHQVLMRPATGDPFLVSVPTTNNAAPEFPNAWLRVQRVGNEFKMFRGTNGLAWEQIGSAEFPGTSPASVWVGPAFSPSNDDLFAGSGQRDLFVAKFRDSKTTNVTTRLEISRVASNQIQLSWQPEPGEVWTLQSTTTLPTGWENAGTQTNPQTLSINVNEPMRFYRLRRPN